VKRGVAVYLYLALLSKSLISLWLVLCALSYFLVKPSILPVQLARRFIGDPIYAEFEHALSSYHLTIIIASVFFVIISAMEVRYVRKKYFYVLHSILGVVVPLFSFSLDQAVSIMRLTAVDCIYCAMLPRVVFFVAVLMVVNIGIEFAGRKVTFWTRSRRSLR